MNRYLICHFFVYKKFGTINGLYFGKTSVKNFFLGYLINLNLKYVYNEK
jgi:hypothetical protein